MGPASGYLARSRLRLPGRIRACFGSSSPAGSLLFHFQMQVAGWTMSCVRDRSRGIGCGRHCRVRLVGFCEWSAIGILPGGGRYKTDRVRREITIVPLPRWAASRLFRAPHPQRQGVEARLITPPVFSIETSLGGQGSLAKARKGETGEGHRQLIARRGEARKGNCTT